MGHRFLICGCARPTDRAAILCLISHHLLDLFVKAGLAICCHLHGHLVMHSCRSGWLRLILQRIAAFWVLVFPANRARESLFALHRSPMQHFCLLSELVDQFLLVLVNFLMHQVELHLLVLLMLSH